MTDANLEAALQDTSAAGVNSDPDNRTRGGPCYAIVRIIDESIVYLGFNLWTAAVKLDPGTCHGKGENNQEATIWARSAARRIRLAQANLSPRSPLSSPPKINL
jgi:hypothetical protein